MKDPNLAEKPELTKKESPPPPPASSRGVDDFRRQILESGQQDDSTPAPLDMGSMANLTEEEQMMRMMGFGGFETTQGKEVKGNNAGANRGAIAKTRKQNYRQYMNRQGG